MLRYQRGFYVREEICEPHRSCRGAVPDESILRFRVSGYATALTVVLGALLYFDVKLYVGLSPRIWRLSARSCLPRSRAQLMIIEGTQRVRPHQLSSWDV